MLGKNDCADRNQLPSTFKNIEGRVRQLAGDAPVMIWRGRTDNHRDWFNKPWLDFTGRTMAQELGHG